jgi:hypothetical protein
MADTWAEWTADQSAAVSAAWTAVSKVLKSAGMLAVRSADLMVAN